MKHESIVVVYDSGLAIAEEIADKLGAETVSVQSVNNRQIENCQSIVLAVEFQADGFLTPHWQYGFVTGSGKRVPVLLATSSIPAPQDKSSRIGSVPFHQICNPLNP